MLTPRERDFHRLLLSACPDHLVFAQVALSQLIDVKRGVFKRELVRRRYKQLVADFVLCRMDYSIVAVIELDDLSHRRPDRQDADRRKSLAVQSAGLRLLRIPAGPVPNITTLRQLLDRDQREEFSAVRPAVRSAATRPRVGLLIGIVAILLILGLFSQGPKVSRQTTAHGRPRETNIDSPMVTTTRAVKGPTESQTPASNRMKPEQPVVGNEDGLALQTRKETAWAEYYTPSASCENPLAHSERVECGNRFLRARRQFDAEWKSQQSASQERAVEAPQ